MQDDDVIDLVLDESPADLDDTHESLIIQGSIDAIDGTESYAVKYLAGAMCGADMLSPYAIHGNESVWTSVKAGFAKSITYVKNVFKGIWNFFFGKESEEKDTEKNSAVEKDKALLAKLPSTAELTEAARGAIDSAADKAANIGKSIKAKVEQGVQAAKIYAEDKQLKEKLDAALEKMVEITEKGVEAAKKQGRGIALAVSIKMTLWAMYFRDFRSVMSSQVKALASKTMAEIEKLESKVKSAGENASAEIKEKLASLKEVMKSYTSIQQLKSSFRSFVTGVVDKLTPSYFAKKA
jgi:hypothetical protein